MEKNIEGILLIGSANFVTKTEKTLNFIKVVSNNWILFIKENIGIIKEGEQSGITVYATPPTFTVAGPTWSSSVTWYASAIVHDANHSALYRKGSTYYGKDAERNCMELQLKFLKECNAPISEVNHLTKIYQTDYDYYTSSKRNW